MSGTANVSELALDLGKNARWAMVRVHFGIEAFGVNAYIADEPGQELVGEHDEMGVSATEHEELYFVGNGHATFTVAGDEIDAPAGTFVFVRDPAAKRKAASKTAGTTVVAVGGKPGEAFTPSAWERQAPALRHFAAREYDEAREELERLLEEAPNDAGVHYNLACAKSLTGKREEALQHLRRAIELEPDFRENAEKDPDLDALRDDPEFASAVAGKTGAPSSGS